MKDEINTNQELFPPDCEIFRFNMPGGNFNFVEGNATSWSDVYGLENDNKGSTIHGPRALHGYTNTMGEGRKHRGSSDLAQPGREGDGNDGQTKGSEWR